MVDVSTNLNNLKTNVDELDVGKLKTVPIDLKKTSDAVCKEVVKKTVYSKLNTKVNDLENKIPDVPSLIQTNKYNTDKQNLQKKVADVENKTSDVRGLVSTT